MKPNQGLAISLKFADGNPNNETFKYRVVLSCAASPPTIF